MFARASLKFTPHIGSEHPRQKKFASEVSFQACWKFNFLDARIGASVSIVRWNHVLAADFNRVFQRFAIVFVFFMTYLYRITILLRGSKTKIA